MRDPRLWAVILAVVWFASGFAAGTLVSAREPEAGPDVRYAAELADHFDLPEHRRRELLRVLEQARLERAEIRRQHAGLFREATEPRFRSVDQRAQDIIRNKIIYPRHRAEFDRLMASDPTDPLASAAPSTR